MTIKRIAAIIICVIMAALVSVVTCAESSIPEFSSYTYDSEGKAIAAPEAFYVKQTVNISLLGVKIDTVSDMDIDADGNIYIIDSGLGVIIKLSPDNELLLYKSQFGDETLKNPKGISVGADGFVYVADTANGRVIKLDKSLEIVSIFEKPPLDDAQYDYEYKPIYVEADVESRLYVIAESQTQGIMQFDKKGGFLGYYGATRVSPSVAELIFRKFATEEQLAGMIRFIPTEYRNMCLDDEGFMYCTVSTYSSSEIKKSIKGESSVTPIRRLNQSGSDILKRNGPFNPVGDVEFNYAISDSLSGASTLVDIAAYKNNIYSALDSKRGRIFTYDKQGNLLYIFGSRGKDVGSFISPVALCYRNNDVLVLDSSNATITVFAPTEYASLINLGIAQYQNGEYEAEKVTWERVLKIFPHSTLALKELGKAFYNNEEYSAALKYFKMAEDRSYYSKALQKYIRINASTAMAYILPIGTAVIIFFAVLVYLKKKGIIKLSKKESHFKEKHPRLCRLAGEVKYSGYVAFHPFDGFWDLKHENRGSLGAATVILVGAIVSNIIRIRLMPFLFNKNDFTETSALYEGIMNIVALVGLWCVSNWCFTTLMDGKGKMRDIYIYTCYALMPLAVLFPIITFTSYFLYIESATFLSILIYFTVVWVGFLIIAGTISTHNYTFTKAFITIVLTVVGMMIIAFLALLIFSIGQEVLQFFSLLFNETSQRI